MTDVYETYVDAPVVTPAPSGLLDHATVIEAGRSFGWRNEEGLFESYNCFDTHVPTTICPDITPGTNEVQTLTGDTATGGTFTITWQGQTTGDITFDATAAEIQAALVSLDNIQLGDVQVTGGPLPTEVQVEFTGNYAETNVDQMTVDNTSMVGGTVTPATSVEGAPASRQSKTFEEPHWAPGVTISVYGGAVCRLVGTDREQAMESLRAAFLANEHKGVERALMETRFQADPGGLWPSATDITPAGGAVSPQCAVAMLEGHAGQVYSGLPTLHLPRVIASQVVNPESTVGDLFYSNIGSKLVNGTGYTPSTGPTGAAPADGETWSWVTGEVLVEKGELRVHDAVDAVNNENFILAERSYRVSVDCFAAGILTAVCA